MHVAFDHDRYAAITLHLAFKCFDMIAGSRLLKTECCGLCWCAVAIVFGLIVIAAIVSCLSRSCQSTKPQQVVVQQQMAALPPPMVVHHMTQQPQIQAVAPQSQPAVVVARPINAPASTSGDALRAQLTPLTVRSLRERALADGCHANDIENARDGDDPKSELIELILKQAAKLPAIDLNALRAELLGMDVRGLRHRAASDGISDHLIEDARDAHDPKAALIHLIIAKAQPKQGP